MTRPKRHLTSATKSNGITFTMPYWDERFAAIGKEYPDIGPTSIHIDILCAHFVQHPDWFDVVVGSNLFGDILSDLGPAVAGSIGIAPSRQHQSRSGAFPRCSSRCMVRRPTSPESTSAIRSARSGRPALMLEHLGEAEAGRAIVDAIETLLRESGPKTRDMGGQAGLRMLAGRSRKLSRGETAEAAVPLNSALPD